MAEPDHGHDPSQAPPPPGEILLYQTDDGRTRVECRFVDESLWLSQALIAELFQVSVPTVNGHLANIYEEGELDPGATIRSFRIVRREGSREVARSIEHYNLDAILAVGYRVRSDRGTQFRQWATQRLREYLVKGFTMDDERLKNPPVEGSGVPDYFDELLERIRDIRASERRMYLRVREIFALAGDYDSGSKRTTEFFQKIQNKVRIVFRPRGKTIQGGSINEDKPTLFSGGSQGFIQMGGAMQVKCRIGERLRLIKDLVKFLSIIFGKENVMTVQSLHPAIDRQ